VPQGRFHRCAPDPGCAYCRGEAARGLDWSFVDAVCCISLASRADRSALAMREMHKIGLCGRVLFYRPEPHPTSVLAGIWEAHRAVARHALAHGSTAALILEDDVKFAPWLGRRRLRAVARAFASLPDDWTIFFLGHWPIRARFVRHNLLRMTSGCAHAYVASPRLLAGLCERPFVKGRAGRRRLVGGGIDASYAAMPGAFAYFPMLAVQAVRGSDHLAAKRRRQRVRKLRHLVTHTWLGAAMLSWLMRPNELVQVVIGAIAGGVSLLRAPLAASRGAATAECLEPGAVEDPHAAAMDLDAVRSQGREGA
jgi:hypothetical protein